VRRWLVVIVTVALASTLALQWGGLAREGGRPAVPAPAAKPLAETPPAHASPPAAPTRDLFAFGDEQGPSTVGSAPSSAERLGAAAAEAAPEPTPEPRVRLIGFVRQRGRVAAVLSIENVIEVASVDEERSGYLILAIDEEAASARVRSPEGETLDVSAPSAH
jgi:hypothetical protein